MNNKLKSFLFWILSLIFTIAFVIYQRTTGPTYPLKGKVEINKVDYKYKLIRTHDVGDALVQLIIPDKEVSGVYQFRRLKSYDDWTTANMIRNGDTLTARLKHLPPAGKYQYDIILKHKQQEVKLNDNHVVIRFKGKVPDWIVLLHVIFIFSAMLLSTRAGIEAFSKGSSLFKLTNLTLMFLIVGGMIFGPIMQKYAFDAYWTGWPFGGDLTDNKTAVALLFWLIAMFVQLKNRSNTTWAKIAALILILVYLIPHSVLGSELDFREETQIENQY